MTSYSHTTSCGEGRRMAYGLSRAEFLRVFTGLAGVAALAPFSAALAQPAAPVGARDMTMGADTAPVTVIE